MPTMRRIEQLNRVKKMRRKNDRGCELFWRAQGVNNTGGVRGVRDRTSFLKREEDEKRADSDANSRIRHVEGWPVIPINIKIQKIDHFTKLQPINEVPNRSSEDTGDGELPPPIVWLQTPKDRGQ